MRCSELQVVEAPVTPDDPHAAPGGQPTGGVPPAATKATEAPIQLPACRQDLPLFVEAMGRRALVGILRKGVAVALAPRAMKARSVPPIG